MGNLPQNDPQDKMTSTLAFTIVGFVGRKHGELTKAKLEIRSDGDGFTTLVVAGTTFDLEVVTADLIRVFRHLAIDERQG